VIKHEERREKEREGWRRERRVKRREGEGETLENFIRSFRGDL
jgi:hypothetical protein